MAAALLLVPGLSIAEEEKPTANFTTSLLSKYVWRGLELSDDSVVIQPSMTIAYKGFSANLWGNLDSDYFISDTTEWTETDLTFAYGRQVGPVSLSGGYIYYGLDGLFDEQELYVSAGLGTLLKPTLTIYRDFSHTPGWYATVGVSHSFALPRDISLDLGARIGYLDSDDESVYPDVHHPNEPFSGLMDGLLSAGLAIPAGEYLVITPQLAWSFPLDGDASDLIESLSVDGDDDSFVYGGVAVSFSF